MRLTEVGRPEWQDLEEILRYLHHLKSVTFVTRDEDFFIAGFVTIITAS